MGWIGRLLAGIRSSRERHRVNRLVDSLVGGQNISVTQNPQQLLQEGWEARHRNQPELAHQKFVAAAQAARGSQDTKGFGRALLALADNALHFFPTVGDTDVFWVRQVLAERAKEILSFIRDDAGVAQALRVLSSVASGPAGREMLEESLQISRRIGDVEGVLSGLERLGSHLALYGDKEEAREFKRKSLEMARVLGDQEQIADCLFSLRKQ